MMPCGPLHPAAQAGLSPDPFHALGNPPRVTQVIRTREDVQKKKEEGPRGITPTKQEAQKKKIILLLIHCITSTRFTMPVQRDTHGLRVPSDPM